MKALKRGKVTLTASGAAKKSGAAFALPYTLSRWDFAAREGDVAAFAKNTGMRFKRGKRSVAPRAPAAGDGHGVARLRHRADRERAHQGLHRGGTAAKATDSAALQTIDGLKLKLTQAGANYVNRGLKRKALRRFSQFGTLDLRLLKPASSPGGGAGGRRRAPWTPPGQGTTPGGTLTINPGLLGMLGGGRSDLAVAARHRAGPRR